jgi:5'-deoxynucleotidase YfbR-like HD superfamily hydrolase
MPHGPEGHSLENPENSPAPYHLEDLDYGISARDYLSNIGQILVEAERPVDSLTGYHYWFAQQNLARDAQYPDGRNQTNAEHCFALASMTMMIIDRMLPHVTQEERGKALDMALGHDNKEVNGGDTPVFNEEKLKTKVPRERAGRTMYREEIKDAPLAYKHEEEYETKTTEDDEASEMACLVNGGDGVEPGLFALHTECFTQHRRGDDPIKMVRKGLAKAAYHWAAFEVGKEVYKEVLSMWNQTAEKWRSERGFDKIILLEGDPELIVEAIAAEIDSQKAFEDELKEIEAADHEEAMFMDIGIGQKIVLNGLRGVRQEQRVITPDEAKEMGIGMLPFRDKHTDYFPTRPAA